MNVQQEPEYAVAIVGSGPAGISLALRLVEQIEGKVLLIESGWLESQPEIHSLSSVEATGDLADGYYPVHAQRLFGGTSNVWSGFCTTLEERSFLNNEWPIGYEEIRPYYKDAAAILELPDAAYQTPTKALGEENNIVYRPYYLSPPVRFGEKYYSHLSEHPNITVLLGTTCTQIRFKDGCVEGLLVQDSEGGATTERLITANYYVLACGGIGNPRLLQLSGLALGSPVGHYLMEHPHIYAAGEIVLSKEIIDPIVERGRISHALQLSDDYCVNNDLLSFAINFNLASPEERVLLGEVQEVYVSLSTIRAEMRPQETNQVSLSDSFDRLEQPKSRVNFNFNHQELAIRGWDALARQLLASSIGRATTPPEFYPEITGGGHYIGTTRMGATAADSVVDADCKMHNLDNLYIAGSSIFSAAGAANPTFSIVAFALRLADTLAAQLQG